MPVATLGGLASWCASAHATAASCRCQRAHPALRRRLRARGRGGRSRRRAAPRGARRGWRGTRVRAQPGDRAVRAGRLRSRGAAGAAGTPRLKIVVSWWSDHRCLRIAENRKTPFHPIGDKADEPLGQRALEGDHLRVCRGLRKRIGCAMRQLEQPLLSRVRIETELSCGRRPRVVVWMHAVVERARSHCRAAGPTARERWSYQSECVRIWASTPTAESCSVPCDKRRRSRTAVVRLAGE
jgi:hypothetical protein